MASASSTFTGTENPLSEGGVWSALSTYWLNPRKANGLGVATLNNDCARRYNPSTLTFTADQFSEITIALMPTGGQLFYHYCFARMNATAGCYLLTTSADISAATLQIWRVSDAGAYTQLGANITLGGNLVAGDVIRLEAVGTTLTAKVNGVTAPSGTRTDSTFASGQPGVGGWAQTGSDVLFTSAWAAADIVAGAAPAPHRSRNPSYQLLM